MSDCTWETCGNLARGRARPGWVTVLDTDSGFRRRYCPQCAPANGAVAEEAPALPPEPDGPQVPAPPVRVGGHESHPDPQQHCAYAGCGLPRGAGRPPRGWVRLWVEGGDGPPLWFCTPACAIVALSPMVLTPLPRVSRRWVQALSPVEAVHLLSTASGQPLSLLGLTGWRVRRSYEIAVTRLDTTEPGWLAHRARLAAARGRLLALLDEPMPSEVDDVDEEPLGASA